MRVAVFSDVHGNLSAFQAVLSAIVEEGVDEMIFAGDLCLFGPRPAESLDLLRMQECASIYGNTDDWLLGRQPPPPHFQDLAAWTHDQLDPTQRAWLDDLPFARAIVPPDADYQKLLIVHANPQDVNQVIFPSEEEQEARYGRIRQEDGELDALLSGVGPSVIVFGHLHIPSIRQWRDKQLINISSVSMPGDDDPRAKYGLFSWDGAAWSFERQYVPFDISPEVAAFRENKPPGWQNYVDTILAEGYFPQKV